MPEETGKSNTHYSYDDYGCTEVTGSQTVANELAYTGGVYDRTTGEYYLNARYYDPEDARFLTQDTYRGESKQPNTWNLYTYCGENPVNYVDPSGHFALALSLPALNFAAAVAAAGAAVLPAVAVACAVVAVGHLAWTVYQHTRVVKKAKDETLVLTDVKEKRQKGKPYRLAYIGKRSKLIKFGKKLHFCEALTILGVSKGVQAAAKSLKKRVSLTKKQFRGSKAWKLLSKCKTQIGLVGIFADSKVAAKTLALATGSHKDPEVHKSGYYGHYHDKNHVVHIWYGEPIYYKI